MIEIKGLCAGYPGKPVLKNISLSITAEKITAILAPTAAENPPC